MGFKAIEEAKRGIIGGKPVKDWVDAPCGAFAKAVRETGVDPMYGLRDPRDPDASIKTYEVTIEYRWSGRAEKTYTVKATSEDEAEQEAEKLFQDDSNLECDDVDDWEVADVDEV